MAWPAPIEDRSIGTAATNAWRWSTRRLHAITAEVPSANIVRLVPSHGWASTSSITSGTGLRTMHWDLHGTPRRLHFAAAAGLSLRNGPAAAAANHARRTHQRAQGPAGGAAHAHVSRASHVANETCWRSLVHIGRACIHAGGSRGILAKRRNGGRSTGRIGMIPNVYVNPT